MPRTSPHAASRSAPAARFFPRRVRLAWTFPPVFLRFGHSPSQLRRSLGGSATLHAQQHQGSGRSPVEQLQLLARQVAAPTVQVGQCQAVFAQRAQHPGTADVKHLGAGNLQTATDVAAHRAGTHHGHGARHCEVHVRGPAALLRA